MVEAGRSGIQVRWVESRLMDKRCDETEREGQWQKDGWLVGMRSCGWMGGEPVGVLTRAHADE